MEQPNKSDVLNSIRKNVNDEKLCKYLIPRLEKYWDGFEKDGLPPGYSIMSVFFDYFDVDNLSDEQSSYVDKIIKIVDNAFKPGWNWNKYWDGVRERQLDRMDKLLKSLYK